MSNAHLIRPEELLAVAAEISGTFPPPRAGTELHLLDVNPHRAHAHWHIDPADLNAARARAGSSPLVIRMHDVTGVAFDGTNPHDTNDTIVSGDEGQTDLHVRKSGRTYLAELGLRQPDGHLERLAISDTVDLPRAPALHVAPLRTEAATVREPAGMDLAGLAQFPAAAPRAASATFSETDLHWPAAEELSRLMPDRAANVAALYAKTDAATSAITTAQEKMSVEILHVPATDALPEPGERPANFPTFAAPPICLEDYLSYSSHNLGAISEDVAVFVEFAVHGSVPPGRRATLFGNEIPVQADGSFLLRRDLLQPGATLPGLFQQSRPVED